MAETFEEYVRRIRGYVASKDMLAVLRSTPSRLRSAVRGASPAALARRPAPGKWSVREILAHLADDELVWGYRIRRMLAESGSAIEGFDQVRWAETGRYGSTRPSDSLDMERSLRAANLALLSGLSKKEWKQYGTHSEFGRLTIADSVELLAGHDLNHLGQIRRILGRRVA